MKIEKIHHNKIKVIFTPEDLIEHNLTPQAVRDNAPHVQKTIMNIVHRAWEEEGLEGAETRLMVEAMPGEEGCMVMYITILETADDLKDALSNVKRKIKLRVKPVQKDDEKRMCITFSDFEDAVRLANDNTDFSGGELYFYNDRYHLIVSGDAPVIFSEFGISNTLGSVCDTVCEHGKKISGNALLDLRTYFKG